MFLDVSIGIFNENSSYYFLYKSFYFLYFGAFVFRAQVLTFTCLHVFVGRVGGVEQGDGVQGPQAVQEGPQHASRTPNLSKGDRPEINQVHDGVLKVKRTVLRDFFGDEKFNAFIDKNAFRHQIQDAFCSNEQL